MDLALSDHTMQILEVQIKKTIESKKFRYVRIVNETLLTNFLQALSDETWGEVFDSTVEISQKFYNFHAKYKQYYDCLLYTSPSPRD